MLRAWSRGASSSGRSPTPAAPKRRASCRRACASCCARSSSGARSSSRRRAPGASGRSRWRWRPPTGAVVAVLPLPPALRADAGAVGERGAALAAAAVERLVEAAEPGAPARAGRPRSGARGARRLPGAVLPGGRPGAGRPITRARRSTTRPGRSTGCAAPRCCCPATCWRCPDLRPPIGATHPLRVAEAVTRLGGVAARRGGARGARAPAAARARAVRGRSRERTTTPTRAGA